MRQLASENLLQSRMPSMGAGLSSRSRTRLAKSMRVAGAQAMRMIAMRRRSLRKPHVPTAIISSTDIVTLSPVTAEASFPSDIARTAAVGYSKIVRVIFSLCLQF